MLDLVVKLNIYLSKKDGDILTSDEINKLSDSYNTIKDDVLHYFKSPEIFINLNVKSTRQKENGKTISFSNDIIFSYEDDTPDPEGMIEDHIGNIEGLALGEANDSIEDEFMLYDFDFCPSLEIHKIKKSK